MCLREQIAASAGECGIWTSRGIVYENLSRELSTPPICGEHSKFTKLLNFRKRYYQILNQARIETKGLHSLRYTFAANLVNRVKQANGTMRALSSKQVADLLRHSLLQITEKKVENESLYRNKKDNNSYPILKLLFYQKNMVEVSSFQKECPKTSTVVSIDNILFICIFSKYMI